MNLAEISYRMATHPDFLSRLKRDPKRTLKQEGLPIDPEELKSLKSFLRTGISPKLGATSNILDLPIDPWYTG